MGKKAIVKDGQVVIRNNNSLEVQFFDAEFVLDDNVKSIGEARIIVQKALLEPYLKGKFPNYKRWRECPVVDLIDTEEVAEQSEIEQLIIEANALGCVPENISNYKRQDYKAKALEKAIAKAKERNAKKKQKENVQDMGYVD